MENWQIPLHEFARRPDALHVPVGSILASSPEQVTAEWLARWTVRELEALARVLAAPSSGSRAVLTERIIIHSKLRRQLASETHESLRARPGKELKAMLKSVKCYAGGNKYGMASGLIGWRDQSRLTGRMALAEANHARHVLRAIRRGEDVPADLRAKYLGEPRYALLFPEE